MESVVVGINLFGAVALLLFGLAQIKDGMSRAFGASSASVWPPARGAGIAPSSLVSRRQSPCRVPLPPR